MRPTVEEKEALPLAPSYLTEQIKRWAPPALTLILFAAGLLALQHLLKSVNVDDIRNEFQQVPWSTLALALLTTLLGYMALVGYDATALSHIDKKLPMERVALGSFCAYALGNTIGLSAVSGGAVRYRFYSGLGLDAAEVAMVSTFCAVFFGIGVVVVGLAALVVHPEALTYILSLSAGEVQKISAIALAVLVGLGALLSISGYNLRLGRFDLRLPRPRVLLSQVLFSVLDITLAGATLYILLPPEATISFPAFVAIFATALLVAVLSHVPGGVGIFESMIIAALGKHVPLESVAASLLLFRIVYYLVPFCLALVLIVLHEVVSNVKATSALAGVRRVMGPSLSGLAELAPIGLAAMVLLSGLFLLLLGLIPLPDDLLSDVNDVLPLGGIEASSILSGALGMVLVMLSTALKRRVKAACWIIIVGLIVGAEVVVMQRLDVVHSVLLLAAAGAIYLSRREFHRSSRLTIGIWSANWFALLLCVSALAAALLFFANKDTAYSHELWWQFAEDQQTPRALRVAASAAVVALLSVLFYALRPPRMEVVEATRDHLEEIRPVVRQQNNPEASLVFTGDKSLLMSSDKSGFIMYAVQGRSWIALGGPVGNPAVADELIYDFVQMADRHNGRAVFYHVSDKRLPLFLDAGFSFNKLGEEAIVPLPTFSMEGSDRKRLRQTVSRAQRDGLSFRIVEAPHASELLTELKQISSEWMQTKHVKEKRFSLGRFDSFYLNSGPLALIEHEGRIVAFANILETDTRQTASIDLMRHSNSAPDSVMEYLFIELMLALKERGFAALSLGLAPLSGLDKSSRRQIWNRLGMTIYRHGGHFYNFEGLRRFKAKFDPEWHPRYLATYGGLDPMLAMADATTLISGGLRGVVVK